MNNEIREWQADQRERAYKAWQEGLITHAEYDRRIREIADPRNIY